MEMSGVLSENPKEFLRFTRLHQHVGDGRKVCVSSDMFLTPDAEERLVQSQLLMNEGTNHVTLISATGHSETLSRELDVTLELIHHKRAQTHRGWIDGLFDQSKSKKTR